MWKHPLGPLCQVITDTKRSSQKMSKISAFCLRSFMSSLIPLSTFPLHVLPLPHMYVFFTLTLAVSFILSLSPCICPSPITHCSYFLLISFDISFSSSICLSPHIPSIFLHISLYHLPSFTVCLWSSLPIIHHFLTPPSFPPPSLFADPLVASPTSMGYCILVVHGLSRLCSMLGRWGTAVLSISMLLLLLLFSWKTVQQNHVWLSREALFRWERESLNCMDTSICGQADRLFIAVCPDTPFQ